MTESGLEKARREAHHARVNLILTHIDPPERAHFENIALKQAMDHLEAAARLAGRLAQAEKMVELVGKEAVNDLQAKWFVERERDRLRAEVGKDNGR